MATALIPIAPFLPLLAQDSLLLTPNNRLRNKLLQAFSAYQNQQRTGCWQAPKILALGDWLTQNYQKLCLLDQVEQPGVVAPPLLRQQLWQQLLAADDQGIELLNASRLIKDCDSAYRSLERWQLSPDDLTETVSAETERFRDWARQFSHQLQSLQLITPESLQRTVTQGFADGHLEKLPLIGLYGFDDIPPLTRSTLSAAAHISEEITLPAVTNCVQRLTLAAWEDEIRAAARWSKYRLQQHPAAKIGIIVPELGQTRAEVMQIFTEEFEAHALMADTPRYTLPFNVSAGVPLGTTPVIHDTLQLLRLAQTSMATSELCNLLYSPFWAPMTLDIEDLNLLSAQLRQQARERLRVSVLRQQSLRLYQHRPTATCQWLSEVLQQVAENNRRHPTRTTASQWVEHWINQLQLLGWPGTRRPDSNEYQQLQQWLSLLEEFVKLDLLNQQFSQAEALDQLQQLCLATPYQAQTPDSPLQILGALEGSGLHFNYCWVMGLSNRQWPPPAQPNPLLPLDLQRRLGMPHADADRELVIARALLEGYQTCAAEVILSSARQDAESHLRPSALIEQIPLITLDELLPTPAAPVDNLSGYLQTMAASRQLEWVNVASGPAVSDAELRLLRGGSSIIKNQAICPFAAFAIHRLGAVAAPDVTPGLSPQDRGNILHDALASIWTTLKTQTALKQQTPEQLKTLVEACVSKALQPMQGRYADLLGPRYFELEQQRQVQLLLRWLDLEKNRPGFTALECEGTLKANFNGLPLTLRLDRLDQLETGELIVIDYKTGKPSVRDWQGEWPAEPQLPLYTLCYSADIHALMFAQINASDTDLCGLGDLQAAHPGIQALADSKLQLPDNWQATCEHWDRVLGRLTHDFLEGDALAEFRHPAQRRFYADLSPLLRDAEQTTLIELFHRFQRQAPQ